jgi:uncharacterized protein (DUF1015 family)
MSKIRPFRGYRPRPDVAADVASPPYDVLDRDEARELIERRPKTFMRVLRADALLDESQEDQRIYDLARENLDALITDGVLVRDEMPCLYLYALTMGEHRQVGVVAGVSAAEYFDGLIKKHEHTRTKDLADRIRHIETLGVNTGPVFLAHRAHEPIDELVDRLCQASEPEFDFVAEDKVRHQFWVISKEADVNALVDAFGELDALYIADGHHRTDAGCQVAKKRAAERGGDAAVLAVVFPHDQVQVLAYNRVVKDLNGLDAEAFLAKLQTAFSCEATEEPAPSEVNTFGMYLAATKTWYRLTAKAGSFDKNNRQAALDCAILQNNLLDPILGIDDPRKSPRIAFVGGIHGAPALVKRADASGGVAFYLYPTAMSQVMDIADANEVMPPKSTWVEPKLRSGLIVRSLED